MNTIDSKELLKDIIKKSDSISIDEIRECWEITGIIDDKRQSLQKEFDSYKKEILASQKKLKELRAQESALKDELKTLESKRGEIKEEIAKLRNDLSVQQAINNSKKDSIDVQQARKSILPGALKSVEIYLKDGSIAKAKPAQKVFGEDVYKKYRVELKENRTLKAELSKIELENKRLNIELRDFYTEMALEGMGALESESKDSGDEVKKPQDMVFSDEDLNDFKKMLKASKEAKENKEKRDKKRGGK